jgi:O-antigen/teichoic acid export membrane protein
MPGFSPMKKHLRTFSASAFQTVMNQFFGLLLFAGMAMLLPKAVFGQVNWAVAVCTTITLISSLGFDHIIVRRLSSGGGVPESVGIYIGHSLLVLTFGALALIGIHFLFPGFDKAHPGFEWIFLGLLATFLSMPFKQFANGKEHFWSLAVMGISGNVLKVATLILLYLNDRLGVREVALMYLISGVLEWLICAALGMKIRGGWLGPYLNPRAYGALIREALPQLGVVLLDSAGARLDWILMGILSTDIMTADYSFSYKAFESSRLPLLIIAPVILPKLSRLYSEGGVTGKAVTELNLLWRVESLICMLIPLVLNVCWPDLIDLVTKGRYGQSTRYVYAVLSLSLPLVYISNFLWTIAFAQGRLRLTFWFSAATLSTNVILNLLLIPALGALGAAIASTGSLLVNVILYLWYVREPALRIAVRDFLAVGLIAAAITISVGSMPLFWWLRIPLACGLYLLLLRAFGFIRFHKPFIPNLKTS